MNRKAILIGLNCDSCIPGVKMDLDAWKDYLISPLGGAWNHDEIIEMENARTEEDIIEAVKTGENADYAFIAFSGHGGIYEQKRNILGLPETFIYLNEHTVLSEYKLNPGRNCKRCTIILDCCRTVIKESYFNKKAFAQEAYDDNIRLRSRNLFDRQLNLSDKGCVKVYATEIGYSAADNPSFSRVLINSSKKHMEKSKSSVLYLNNAVEYAKEVMLKYTPQQIPQYRGGRRLNHYPFAVNPTIIY